MLVAIAEVGMLLTFQTLPTLCKVKEQHQSSHKEQYGVGAPAWGSAQQAAMA